MTHISEEQLETIYPAVIECFAVILLGYIAGRVNLVSAQQSKGLNTFVSHFSLPALIFLSLAKLEFKSVNWTFLLSIFISKTFLFIFVTAVTVIVSKTERFGKAGLFSIFCTQSNDFALGYPVVEALYKKIHPDYSNYLYLVAPVSLVFLNPIGFVMLEIEKRSQCQDGHQTNRIVWKVLRGVVLNPVILMTTFGIVGNFIFDQKVPVVLEGILKVLGSAFSATALFCLGLKMVGRIGSIRQRDIIISTILIGLKLLVLPLVIRETVILFNAGDSYNETSELSTYGFLYGTFPPAPGIFVFAQQYNIEADLIATGLIGCTFLSAPLIFVSAKMISMHFSSNSDYLPEFTKIIFNVGIITLLTCIWTYVYFCIHKKWRLMPHWFTFCLLNSQLVICISAILWNIIDRNVHWQLDLQFIMYTTSVYSARIWTALLALGILFLRWRSLCFILRFKTVFMMIGWGLPLILVLCFYFLFTRDSIPSDKIDPNLVYGIRQVAASTSILIVSLLITIFCLIVYQKLDNSENEYQPLINPSNNESQPNNYDSLACQPTNGDIIQSAADEGSAEQFSHCDGEECKVKKDKSASCCLQDMEDLISSDEPINAVVERNATSSIHPPNLMCGVHFPCDMQQRQICSSQLKRYKESTDEICAEESFLDHQYIRHNVLLFLLCFSMFVGLSLLLWQMVLKDISGIYVELEFLDGILNVGQGFLTFAIFGANAIIFSAIKRRLIKIYSRWNKNSTETTEITHNNGILDSNEITKSSGNF